MQNLELNYTSYNSANEIITEVAKKHSFDTFVHFQKLAEFSNERKLQQRSGLRFFQNGTMIRSHS